MDSIDDVMNWTHDFSRKYSLVCSFWLEMSISTQGMKLKFGRNKFDKRSVCNLRNRIKLYQAYAQKQPFSGVLEKRCSEKCSKFTGGNTCRIALQRGRSPVNLLHIFRTSFPKNTSEGLLLYAILEQPPLLLSENINVNFDFISCQETCESYVVAGNRDLHMRGCLILWR